MALSSGRVLQLGRGVFAGVTMQVGAIAYASMSNVYTQKPALENQSGLRSRTEVLANEGFMNGLDGLLALGKIDGHGDLDFARGNHADVYTFSGKGFKQPARDAGVRLHADPDDGKLADLFIG